MQRVGGNGVAWCERAIRVNGRADGEHLLRRSSPEVFAPSPDYRPMIDQRHGATATDGWAAAVGRSIIAFARVEHAATLLIRQCTSDALGRRLARLDLISRLAYFDKLVRSCGLTKVEQRLWRRVHKKIEALRAKYRTILAYGTALPGPIEFTGDSVIVRSAHPGRRRTESLLTLPQVELAAEDIGAAHVEFVESVTAILARLVAEHRLPLSTAKLRGGQFA
jgi:hypothetical protein